MKALVPVLCLAVPMAAGAQEADAPSLLRRLEAAEARIKALEERLARVAPPPAAAPSPAAPAADVEPPPERPITHHSVAVTFNGLVQAWYAAGNEGFRDTFRIRRSELYFNGRITEKARWQIMLDPSKALALDAGAAAVNPSTRVLQNAVVTFDAGPGTQVSVGQFKLPLGLEGRQSSGRLDTVERALFASDRARGGALADVRDIGILARWSSGTAVEVQAGVFNGVAETQNDVDGNDQKAVAGSIAWRPRRGLHLGASGAWGNGRGDRPRRDRAGAEVELVRGPFTVRSELMAGRDGAVERMGAYGHLGYRLTPRLEAVFRLDQWDPDTRSDATAATVGERDYVLGMNVFLSRHNLKLQASYLRKTFREGVLPSRGVVLLNTQTFW
jgi:phosphate-selective porin